nr:SMP-30/Gluconolaconase/LRE-like region protein [uncultured bacterium]
MIAKHSARKRNSNENSKCPRHNPAAGWQPATYYPDPAIHALDPRFEKYWLKLSAVERLTTGLRWAEGPVWFGDGRYLLCSDIPNNRIIKWEEETGAVSHYRKPSNFANGHTRDRQGRLISCEHGGRRVVRTEYDGSITVLIDSFNGKRLNSPNDVVVKSDGSIWFTDPIFGLLGNYEGYKAEPELDMNVYRIDGATGKATIVAEGILGPNGLCFSPDEKILYVIESRGVPTRKILAYDVSPGGGHAFRQARVRRCRSRHARRHAFRHRRQSVVRLGHGRSRTRRRCRVRPRRRDDRPHRPAGALRQSLFWRLEAQPAVHGGESVDLRTVCEHARRARGIGRRHPLAAPVQPFFSCAAAVCLASPSSNAFSSVAA